MRSLRSSKGDPVIGLLTTSHLVQNNRAQAVFLIERIRRAAGEYRAPSWRR